LGLGIQRRMGDMRSFRQLLLRPRNASAAFKLTLAVMVVTLCSPMVFASQQPSSATLEICQDDGTVLRYQAFPESAVNMLFPTGKASFEPDSSPGGWKNSPSAILKKIKTGELYDTGRRFSVVGVTFGEQLFIFDELFGSANSVVMSQLLRATSTAPRDNAVAVALVGFYLSLSYYRLEDPARFVVYKVNDALKRNATEDARSSSPIRLPHPPLVVQMGANYKVEVYAYDAPELAPERFSKWQFRIGPTNLVERLSAHHEGFVEYYSKLPRARAYRKGDVRFSSDFMADGITDDGARTDIQFWTTSDGPGVDREHFYYTSHELADRRMQDYLRNAVAIIKTQPWLDSAGKVVGTEALVIETNDNNKTLLASDLFEDEKSVLKLTCRGLSNLIVAQDR
jgi:hypothetical protein